MAIYHMNFYDSCEFNDKSLTFCNFKRKNMFEESSKMRDVATKKKLNHTRKRKKI
jgi:hypothetical protein